MIDGVLYLISQTKEQDDYGVWKSNKTESQVYCSVQSISMAEFYEAGRNGLNPAYRFLVFQGDYNGEELCRFEGNQYAIYRTFRRDPDTIELYVERKGGTNGTTQGDT